MQRRMGLAEAPLRKARLPWCNVNHRHTRTDKKCKADDIRTNQSLDTEV